jgi:hypothetical protein
MAVMVSVHAGMATLAALLLIAASAVAGGGPCGAAGEKTVRTAQDDEEPSSPNKYAKADAAKGGGYQEKDNGSFVVVSCPR